MDHFREIKNQLTWHKEGKFEVELINGVITKLNFCEPGKGTHDTGKCLTSTNFKYLQSVHACLGDLFNFIEEENTRLGYKYAQHVSVTSYHQGDAVGMHQSQEATLRPIMNYGAQPDEDQKDNTLGHGIELTA